MVGQAKKIALVRFDFLPLYENELELRKGQTVLIIEEDSKVVGWAKGLVIEFGSAVAKAIEDDNIRLLNDEIRLEEKRGKVGFFPTILLHVLTDDDDSGDTKKNASKPSLVRRLNKRVSARQQRTRKETETQQNLEQTSVTNRFRSSSEGDVNIKAINNYPRKFSEPPSFEKANKRMRVMREILETERNYVFVLESIERDYLVPMQQIIDNSKGDITANIVPCIFSNVREILSIQRKLLEALLKRIQTDSFGDDTVIGDIFLQLTPFLLSYTRYVNNYEAALGMITECESNKNLPEFLRKRTGSLPELLITPVQRLPRYQMLLTELLKNTEEEHPDRDVLAQALQKVTEVTQQVNSRKAEFESTNKIWEIQSKFSSWLLRNEDIVLLKPSRRFLFEGEAIIDGKDRTMYLFNDSVLFGNPTALGDRKTVYLHLRLCRATLEETSVGFLFKTRQETVTINQKSESDKEVWIRKIQSAIDSRNKVKQKQAEKYPLHEVCRLSEAETLKVFIELSSATGSLDINQRDGKGRTALMIAAKTGNLATTKLLVEIARADPDLKDNAELTALDFAKLSGHSLVMEYLSNSSISLAALNKIKQLKSYATLIKKGMKEATINKANSILSFSPLSSVPSFVGKSHPTQDKEKKREKEKKSYQVAFLNPDALWDENCEI